LIAFFAGKKGKQLIGNNKRSREKAKSVNHAEKSSLAMKKTGVNPINTLCHEKVSICLELALLFLQNNGKMLRQITTLHLHWCCIILDLGHSYLYDCFLL
jgi:hypothetical protein